MSSINSTSWRAEAVRMSSATAEVGCLVVQAVQSPVGAFSEVENSAVQDAVVACGHCELHGARCKPACAYRELHGARCRPQLLW
jgi:hypothetical protein